MTPSSRLAEARDAVVGVMPRMVFTPSSVDECVASVAHAAGEKMRLAFIGGGTALGLGHAPLGLDAVVSTVGLGRIVEYAPADMVITVEAGATLAAVQAVTREHRQRLALDAPNPSRSTIGGLVATAGFGPSRARYGAIRDLLLGLTIVRADGVVAHGGGKVVKNVAGFDLPKVICGSLGTLGGIVTATFRLHPLPEVTSTAVFAGLSAFDVTRHVAALRDAQLEPSRVVALRVGSRFDLGVSFEGFEKGVAYQLARLREIGPCDVHSSDAAFTASHDRTRTCGPLRIKVASPASRLPDVDEAVAPLLDSLEAPSFSWYASLGVGFAGGDLPDAAISMLALEGARARLVALGGSLVVEEAPAGVRAKVDSWGPVPKSFPIMKAMKRRFDPDNRLNPGRFVGGL